MPADNITQILAWNEAIDAAVAGRLEACKVPAFVTRDREDLPDAYALPLFQKGAASGHLAHLPAVVGGFEYDIFTGSIVGVEIFCPRVSDEKNPEGVKSIAAVYDLLGELATRARYAFSFNSGARLNALLPFHKLSHLKPLADVVGFDEERGVDRFELRWECIAGVRPDAWPVALAGYDLPS